MRADTKLAIVVAALCIVFGAWYITTGKKTPRTESVSTTAEKRPAATGDTKGSPPRLAQKDSNRSSAQRTPLARGTSRQESTASPKPQVDTSGSLGSRRPQPAVTSPPQGATPGPVATVSQEPKREGVGLADGPALTGAAGVTGQSVGETTASAGMTPALPTGAPTTQPTAAALGMAAKNATDLAVKSTPKASAEPSFVEHTIQAGDTFSALAAKYMGHAKHAKQIAEANPNLDPRKLRVGAVVKVPVLEKAAASPNTVSLTGMTVAGGSPTTAGPSAVGMAPKAAPVPPDRAYEVKQGEGWYTLAARFLGSGSRWTELYELNKGRAPANFNILPAGTVIELPSGATRTAQ